MLQKLFAQNRDYLNKMSLKTVIKNSIVNRIDDKYLSVLANDKISYANWIDEEEAALEKVDVSLLTESGDLQNSFVAKLNGVSLRIVPYSAVNDDFSITNYIEDVIVFYNGKLSDIALPLIADTFSTKSNISVVYGDEDIIIGGSDRCNPFFKPDWSPNTFIDHFYFCNVVAIRRFEFRDFAWSKGFSGAASIYHTLLRYLFSFEKNLIKVWHISDILVHAENYDNNYVKDSDIDHLVERLVIKDDNDEFISVIIPSKDNPHLLEPCISSIINTSHDGIDLDIVVVDNGSSPDNLEKINELKDKYSFRHIYEPMEFNFAKMCNLGASVAKGKYLLFLNDDATFDVANTLNVLLREIKFRFSGAVGAKLLYPNSGKIQHAGVFNNRIGPVHKFQFMSDEIAHFHGFTKSVNNVLAVTGACLLVRKEVYDKVGGMSEKLKVAFNDIDLCFKIYEAGYVNVVCNNVHLIHAESITRGKDTSESSLKRLLEEKDKLYSYHPNLRGVDPFYNRKLVNDCLDTRMSPSSEYEYEKAVEELSIFKEWDTGASRIEQCLQIGVEYSGKLSGFTYENDGDEAYYIQGYSFVTGSDNACYKKSLILHNEDNGTYIVSAFNGCIRSDVAENLPDQKNVERSGFALKISEAELPVGNYRIGILFENIIARERLYNYTNNFLNVLSQS